MRIFTMVGRRGRGGRVGMSVAAARLDRRKYETSQTRPVNGASAENVG